MSENAMSRKVVVWIGQDEILIPANQIPGAIADMKFPRPDRTGGDWNESEGQNSPNDPCAVKRLMIERQQAIKLREAFPNLPEDYGFSMSQSQAYLADLGLELEVRRFGDGPEIGQSGKTSSDDSGPKKRRRIYDEIEMIAGFETITAARIRTTLSGVAGTAKSCVKEITIDSIKWIDNGGKVQETTDAALCKWLQRRRKQVQNRQ